jgi:hypothetical protein
MSLVMPADAVATVTADVRLWGNPRLQTDGVETGGFLLAPRGGQAVSVVALAGTRGVLRTPLQFTVSGQAIEVLSEWADEHSLRILAQFHSHRDGAALSPIDRVGGIRVENFVTTVVPTFSNPPTDPTRWGWWRFYRGDWMPEPRPISGAGGVQAVLFDEVGTRE